jgi:hypothetical protein
MKNRSRKLDPHPGEHHEDAHDDRGHDCRPRWQFGVCGAVPEAKPDDAGFSQQGLTRLDDFFVREISARRVPGVVVAIARDGKPNMGGEK